MSPRYRVPVPSWVQVGAVGQIKILQVHVWAHNSTIPGHIRILPDNWRANKDSHDTSRTLRILDCSASVPGTRLSKAGSLIAENAAMR